MKKILFIVGPHASGKTYSTNKYLKENAIDDILVIDTGPIMRELHKKSGKDISIGKWVTSLEKEYGNDITSRIIFNEIKIRIDNENKNNIILIGFRTVDTIRYVIEKMNIYDFSILYIDGSINLLLDNYQKREKINISIDDFIDYLEKEQQSGLGKLRNLSMSDNDNFSYFYKEKNDDSFEHLILNYFNYEKAKVKNLKGKVGK